LATLRNTGVSLNAGWDVGGPGGGRQGREVPLAPPSNTATSGFGSLHVGGAQFLLADGAVRFLSENIDPKIYSFLGSREDLQPMEDF
jgi:hypothetical protein